MARVMLFARRPRAGRVKTRLAREIGEAAALALYRSFLDDLCAWVAGPAVRHEVELWLDGPWEEVDGAAPALPCRIQPEGDLGRRLAAAIARAKTDRALPAVLIGADAPTLPESLVDGAVSRLTGPTADDVAVAPADDGGYVLLALRRPLPQLFEGIAWGGPRVLEQTLARAAACGASVARLPGWYDVDDGAGLERLRRELTDPIAAARAPRTAATLADLDRARGRMV